MIWLKTHAKDTEPVRRHVHSPGADGIFLDKAYLTPHHSLDGLLPTHSLVHCVLGGKVDVRAFLTLYTLKNEASFH